MSPRSIQKRNRLFSYARYIEIISRGYGAAGSVGLRFSLTPHLRDPAPAAVRWEPDGAQLRQRSTI